MQLNVRLKSAQKEYKENVEEKLRTGNARDARGV